MANTLAEVKTERLSDKVTHVKAEKLNEMRY